MNNLVTESQKSVYTIASLNDDLTEQNQQLHSTKDDMDGVVGNVGNVEIGARGISEKIKYLETSKERLTGIITDLSKVSESNAAAAMETNNSMKELNNTFEVINNAAIALKQLANDLNDQMQFFELGE